ncbi:MAG: hypothetical protein HZA50_12005 [Planctomycetes bacterium]|nr:hypothetical protein [Planctomycetota bacterium]
MTEWLGRLIGVDDLRHIRGLELKFTAVWAAKYPALLLFGCLAVAAIAIIFYFRYQPQASMKWRVFVAAARLALLVLLVLILAEPIVVLKTVERSNSIVAIVFDGTDSMNIRDKLSPESLKKLEGAAGQAAAQSSQPPSRLELLKGVLANGNNTFLGDLAKEYRLRAYVLDQPDQLRQIDISKSSPIHPDGQFMASQIKADGTVTAVGGGIEDLFRRHGAGKLAGVVFFSDFDQNAGAPAAPCAQKLASPIYAVGIGPPEVVDLAVEMQSPLVLKKDERVDIVAHIRQSGLTGRGAQVQLLGRKLGSAEAQSAPRSLVQPIPVSLDSPRCTVNIPFKPAEVGKFALEVKVEPFPDEVLVENNVARREVNIQDQCLKLEYIEYEPNWEWRFVKEVFYRDPLVGKQGFKTFLRSSDMKVRQAGEIYLDSPAGSRSDFFSNDVIFLGDVPANMLTTQVQDMLLEYVGKFGGGLVIISGPQFGPSQLANTKLAQMLPVVPDPAAALHDASEFALKLTPQAKQFDFMNLGANEQDNRKAWANMSGMPWYQPVLRPHPLATVLAVHPSEKCSDGQTPQPLIVARKFGKGEVIYLGFNEMWRLRKKYGEKYYRQFWGQLIYRLGLGRALGSQKRFVVETDRRIYQAGDKVRVTAEAYNANFEPLETAKLDGKLMQFDEAGTSLKGQSPISIPLGRDKVVFETMLPVFTTGQHRLLVRDPVTSQDVEVGFQVAPVTAERRNAVMDSALQQSLAGLTGGKAYDLADVNKLAADIAAPQYEQMIERRFAVWNTWLCLILVVTLMLGEWAVRKWINLA